MPAIVNYHVELEDIGNFKISSPLILSTTAQMARASLLILSTMVQMARASPLILSTMAQMARAS